ncbi:dTDP-4-dehydrorhamnose 3,5-epimerase [Alcanivorax jadensis T9]|jgi:dTDP-4-dehydrorhamnose 3,5-epimerase|uniref:dTDP-4-dehydrorhamnose 3,5-epimerase n=1 Tax=Alcanivorax jadensis T9 TaxID=1177181 RepID=A0ABR4WCN0_9GAMM|nr:dTDP-4-dehydrorhamnose 3,5-epimerase [Alcanivorax jadensis]KGD61217.1 dTDP-4-dehydrorhamnose 3,5-epimerase [Alcanivorax jadensis T9]MBP23511.1 dTDP-4-dehydrorhamnose 3,5-epimerase [Alcanivorax sp.]
MQVTTTRITDVKLIHPRIFEDSRGFFMESWNARAMAEAGIAATFVQDNHSLSIMGTLRGLHYQLDKPQGKLVRCTAGSVFDVAVDLRPESSTYRQWAGETLSSDNKLQLWIPPGFAHGFLVLSDEAEVQYKCTEYYSPTSEQCIHWADPSLAIDWPLVGEPLLSEKDAEGLALADAPPIE